MQVYTPMITMIVIQGREVAETYKRRRDARTSLCMWKVLGKFKSNTEIPRVFESVSSGKKCPHILCICVNVFYSIGAKFGFFHL